MSKRGIYKITNTVNNKIYVGESLDIERRWEEHKEDLNSNKHHSYKLQQDWNEYGDDSFKFEIVTILDNNISKFINKFILLVYEDRYIKEYNSIDDGYNIENTLEKVLSDEKSIFNSRDKSLLEGYVYRINEQREFINENGMIHKIKIYKLKDLKKLLNINDDNDLINMFVDRNIMVHKRKGYRTYDYKFTLSEEYINSEDVFMTGDSVNTINFTEKGLNLMCDLYKNKIK